jgi:hypothetical protein
MLAQDLQLLRRLPGKEFLLAARLTKVSQVRGGCGGDRFDAREELSERHHEFWPSAVGARVIWSAVIPAKSLP